VHVVAVLYVAPGDGVPLIVDEFDAAPVGWVVLQPITVPTRRGKAFPSSSSHYRRREVVTISVHEGGASSPFEIDLYGCQCLLGTCLCYSRTIGFVGHLSLLQLHCRLQRIGLI
jgi:hypothetical protein